MESVEYLKPLIIFAHAQFDKDADKGQLNKLLYIPNFWLLILKPL